ncbi:MAG: portal protein, partial [Candidatus Nanopelagicaceae bacterium]
MAKLFGFSIDEKEQKSKSIVSPVPQTDEDGVDYYIQSGFYGQYVDIEGVYRTEFDLLRRYREMALHPECDSAIEDVVNEAIVSDLYDSPVEIELSNLNASDKLKQIIRKEFKSLKEMMDFDRKSHEIFRNWYVDGRLYYLKVIDTKKPEAGIQELRYIDPMKMKHVRQEKKTQGKNGVEIANRISYNGNLANNLDTMYSEMEEYFIYSPTPNYPMGNITGGSKGSIKIAKDSITYCTSGLVDRNKGTVLSYLHKAIKALNQLRMIEDSLVIYRLSRAPER